MLVSNHSGSHWLRPILLIVCLFFGQVVAAQTVTLRMKDATIPQVFLEIKKQTGYGFVYKEEDVPSIRINIEVDKLSVEETVRIVLANIPWEFEVMSNMVVLWAKEEHRYIEDPAANTINVRGRVIDEQGMGIPHVNIIATGSRMIIQTDSNGNFLFRKIRKDELLHLTCTGYEELFRTASFQAHTMLQMKPVVKKLDEVLITEYSRDQRRLSTGNIGKVSGNQLTNQPVSNVLAALDGRVAGLDIVQTNGISGSVVNALVRGRSSLDQHLSRNYPLLVIDGVPFESGTGPVNLLPSAAGFVDAGTGLSAIGCINMADIESVSVLKDAAATAIYGSRGANGVILITSRKGTVGRMRTNIDVYTGLSRITKFIDFLSTPQYRMMRSEGFRNDQLPVSLPIAADITGPDSLSYTDVQRLLVGQVSRQQQLQVSLSGGDTLSQYLFTVGWRRETSIFSAGLDNTMTSLRSMINLHSRNKKFRLVWNTYYARDHNKLIQDDLTRFINLPPTVKWLDSAGNLNWLQQGISFDQLNISNPLALIRKKYDFQNDFFSVSCQMQLNFTRQLVLRSTLGFTRFGSDETAINPSRSFSPLSGISGYSNFGSSMINSLVAETQLEYMRTFGILRGSLMAGATWQQRSARGMVIAAADFRSDELLSSLPAAGTTDGDTSSSMYRYGAVFARMSFNVRDQYILDLTARRDGSSRFGPGKQLAGFGSVSAAWIISQESFFQRMFPWVSFLKYRASWGITGNDQIGDYKYHDLWNPAVPYQRMPAYQPASPSNPNYSWERTGKLELAMELGLIRNKLLFTAAWYDNRSNNLLLDVPLPDQTGFQSITRNFPARVRNYGFELSLYFRQMVAPQFQWTLELNATVPRNRLEAFPGLEHSVYAPVYSLGRSIDAIIGYRSLGVSKDEGIYTFEDLDKDGKFPSAGDYTVIGKLDPELYGGIQNTFEYKGISLGIFCSFRKQQGWNSYAFMAGSPPGLAFNQPARVIDRWQMPGDNVSFQRYTSQPNSAAAEAAIYQGRSDAAISDASYWRVRNIVLAYTCSPGLSNRLRLEKLQVYVKAQNLFTFTRYKDADPETRNMFVLPPLKTIVVGFQVEF